MVKLEKFSLIFLEKSWEWLNDPETKFLTDTPDFTKAQQKEWFDSLKEDPSYRIWGITYDEQPIGVFGIKNLDFINGQGEYWGYIGESKYRGRGIGKSVLRTLIEYAKKDLGLKSLHLKVIEKNKSAINFYLSFGFTEVEKKNGKIYMVKKL